MKIFIMMMIVLTHSALYADYVDIETGLDDGNLLIKNFRQERTGAPYLLGDVKAFGGTHQLGCAIDQTQKMKCWNNSRLLNELQVPQNVSQITVGGSHVCLLSDEGVTCSFLFSTMPNSSGVKLADSGQTAVPKNLKNPRYISAGRQHTCALDDDGVKCWGDKNKGQFGGESFKFKNPTHVKAGQDNTCVRDDSGTRC